MIPQDPQGQDPGEERFMRMVKARADALARPRYFDDGTVAIAAMPPREAMATAAKSLPSYLRVNQDSHDAVRDYLSGKVSDLPPGWLPDETPIESKQTIMRRVAGEAMQANPAVTKGYFDYVIDPALSGVSAALQVPVSLGVGAYNLFGGNIHTPQVKQAAVALGKTLLGKGGKTFAETYEAAGAEIKGAEDVGDVGSGVVRKGAELVGMAKGLSSTPGKIGMAPGTWAADKVAKVVEKLAGKELPAAARKALELSGGFAGYEALTAEGKEGAPSLGERAKAGAWGAVSGAAISLLGDVGKVAFTKILQTGLKQLGPDEKAAVDALKQWAVKNKVHPLPQEMAEPYMKRVVDQWVDAGAPGARMPFRKLFAYASQGGIEGMGFSLLDAQFRTDLMDAITTGNPDKIASALETMAGNGIGAAALHVPLRDIVPWQRKQVRPTGQDPNATPPPPAAAPQAPSPPPAQPRDPTLPQEPVPPAQPQGRTPTPPQGTPKATAAAEMYRQNHLWRYGWAPVPQAPVESKPPVAKVEGKPGETNTPEQQALVEKIAPQGLTPTVEYEIPNTSYGYSVEGGVVRPSPKLRSTLGLPESMPEADFDAALEKASLLNALHAKAMLPGTEISVEGPVLAEPGEGDAEGVMRRMTFGDVQEAPLRPEGKFRTPDGPVPARGKDVLSPFQENVVSFLRGALNRRQDLPQDAQVMLGSVIEVLDTVSAENDQSVAEMLGTIQDVGRGIATGSPEHAAQVIKAAAEMLTVKHPDVAIDDLMAEQAAARPIESEPEPAAATEQLLEAERPEAAPEVVADKELISTIRADLEAAPRAISHALDTDARLVVVGKPRALESYAKGSFLSEPYTLEDVARAFTGTRELLRERYGDEIQLWRVPSEPKNYHPDVKTLLMGTKKIAKEFESGRGKALSYNVKLDDVLAAFATDNGRYHEFIVRKSGLAPHGPTEAMGGLPIPTKLLANIAGRIGGLVVDNPLLRAFTTDTAAKIERKVGKPLADQIRRAEANTRRDLKLFEPTLREMAKLGRGRVRELEPIRWQPAGPTGVKSGYTLGHILKETRLMSRFGVSRSSVSPEAQQWLKLWDEAHYVTREKAHDLGVEIRNLPLQGGARTKVAQTATRDVMTRQFTPEASDALLGGGKLRTAIVDALAEENGMTTQQVEKVLEENGWTEARGVSKTNPLEIRRMFEFMPDHIEVGGEVHRILETQPLRHAKRLIHQAAMQLGTIEEFGQDIAPTTAQTQPGYVGNVPTPYRHIVESVDKRHQDLVATALRASMGMALNKPLLTPGDPGYKAVQGLFAAIDVLAASKMTMSWVQNLTEGLGTASTFLGFDRFAAGYGKAWDALIEGGLTRLVEQRADIGGFSVHIPDWVVGGETTGVEKMQDVARVIANVELFPFDLTQTLTDTGIHIAIEKAIADMQAGRGRASDAAFAQLVGFSEAEADAMAKGNGTPEQYERLQLGGLSRITRRGDLPINKSTFGNSRYLSRLVRLTNYIQRQLETVRTLMRRMRDAKTNAEGGKAMADFAKLATFNMLAGMAAGSIMSFLRQHDGFSRWWREAYENPGYTATAAVLSTLAGGMGSAVAGAFTALIMGTDDEKAQALDRAADLFLPLSFAIDIAQFATAAIKTAAGEPIGEGPYAGKTPLQQLGYFVGQQVPAARTVEGGIFGLGATYLGTDPKIEADLQANNRWERRNNPGRDFTVNPDKQFVDTMRSVETKLRSKDGYNEDDIESAIREAMPEKDDKAVHASFLRRRVLVGERWDSLTEEQQASKVRFLGKETVELLQGYDAALDAMAERFKARKRFR